MQTVLAVLIALFLYSGVSEGFKKSRLMGYTAVVASIVGLWLGYHLF